MISPSFAEEYSTPPPKFSLIHKLLFERSFWSFTVDEMKLFWGHQISSSLGLSFPSQEEINFHHKSPLWQNHHNPPRRGMVSSGFSRNMLRLFGWFFLWDIYIKIFIRYSLRRFSKCLLRKIEYTHVEKKHFIETACAKLHSHRVWVKCARLPLNSCIFQHHLPTFPAGTCSSIQACRGQEIG